MVINKPNIIIRKLDRRRGKIYKSIAIRTCAMQCLNEYYDMSYKNKIKVVPRNIVDFPGV